MGASATTFIYRHSGSSTLLPPSGLCPYAVATSSEGLSGGNVFADLGFDANEAEHLRLRARLMMELRRLIENGG